MVKLKSINEAGAVGFMKPDEVLDNLDIQEGMKIADFGCGAGYFSIPLAKRCGKKGAVYAIDVQQSALEAVRGKANIENILNIETIRGNLEKEGGSGIDNEHIDIVMIANILFQSKLKDAILKEAKRILKKTGRIVIIEWNGDISFGPTFAYRISKEDLKELVKESGFILEKEFNSGSSHYGLVFSL